MWEQILLCKVENVRYKVNLMVKNERYKGEEIKIREVESLNL